MSKTQASSPFKGGEPAVHHERAARALERLGILCYDVAKPMKECGCQETVFTNSLVGTKTGGRPAENPEKQDIRYSLRDGWRDAYNNWQVANKHNLTFSQLVMAEIRRKDMTSVAFYTAAGLDRRLFSQMANDPNYQPSKRTAILCCLALKLDIHQAEHVLQLAGYALSRILREDLAARYCIQHGIWNVMDVMEVLDSVQENE